MRIYSQVRLGVSPQINAACTILIGLVALGIVTVSAVNRLRGEKTAVAALARATA
jgi:putrescine transport system permease protein